MALSASMLAWLLVSPLTIASPSPAAVEPADPAAAQPVSDPSSSFVVVRVAFDGGEEIASVLHAEITAALRDAQLGPEASLYPPLEVTVAPDAEGLSAYEVTFRHRGEIRRAWSCPCSGDELRARLARDAVEVWHEIVAEPPASPAPAAKVAPDARVTPPRSRHLARGRALWTAGIAATAVGLALVVGTGALLAGDAAVDRDRHPAAIGLMGGGAALTVSGVALWSIGTYRLRSRLAIQPAPRAAGAILTLSTTF